MDDQRHAAWNDNNIPSPHALNAVERYDGRTDAHSWLNILNGLARLYRWSDQACLTVATLRMTGMAQTWLQSRHLADWADFQDAFLKRFGETKETAISRLESCFQYAGESPKAFADRYLRVPPYRPPFRDQGNNGPRPSAPIQAVVAATNANAIDDLTRRFEKLEINFNQQLRDRDREIHHLRHALLRPLVRLPVLIFCRMVPGLHQLLQEHLPKLAQACMTPESKDCCALVSA